MQNKIETFSLLAAALGITIPRDACMTSPPRQWGSFLTS